MNKALGIAILMGIIILVIINLPAIIHFAIGLIVLYFGLAILGIVVSGVFCLIGFLFSK